MTTLSEINPEETAEQFQARYPRPKSTKGFQRVLVRCSCDFLDFEHWGWAYWDLDYPDGDMPAYEALAEEKPTLKSRNRGNHGSV